ncbi:MAG: DUF2284 domain-containing protein [Lachnospiraceae bacterium]|nr:DUF2284 domain-containing protein [Lachnospiraceae bacterium]
MKRKELIETILLNHPICEYYFGTKEEMIFSDKAWAICARDCARYGHCWTCPPYCGTIEEKIAKCRQYDSFCLYSTVTETPNAWEKATNLRVKRQHDDLTLTIRDELVKEFQDFYILSTGCTECQVCTCPDAPCRFPEKRFFSMESHGVIVMEMLDKIGMCSNYGQDTVVYFTMILFNEVQDGSQNQ